MNELIGLVKYTFMDTDVGLTVWIVDDDNVTSFIMRRLLELDYHFGSTLIIPSATEALQRIVAAEQNVGQLPDLILLDLNMPVMDGWEFLKEIGKLNFANDVRVFLLTASINPLDAQAAEATPRLNGFFTKPVSSENIREICKIVQNH